MGTKLSLKYVRTELENHRDVIRDWKNYLPESDAYGLTVPIQWQFKHERPYKNDTVVEKRRMYLHFYYDTVRALEDERNFSKLICRLYNELLSQIIATQPTSRCITNTLTLKQHPLEELGLLQKMICPQTNSGRFLTQDPFSSFTENEKVKHLNNVFK